MPQINRIRVNNVNYNDGTQRYDDFIMNFSCRNALYDLVNGGGKSILLMLIMQTVLPNQELDKKQPVSKLFKNSNNNNTIHSMVEWKLDKEAKERFRANYLLTGFCAKKGTEGKGEVEYFNYIITYNQYNDYDIKNFSLSDGKEKVNFSNMRKKLRSMQDGSYIDCHVELFETNESYKRRLAEFGIYESHWNIVRGINESEGHVRTYMEKNYKTGRQLIDKLLISEIIEKANEMKLENKEVENELADSLIDIQDKMLELSKKNKDKDKYEKQVEYISSFIDKLCNYEDAIKEKDSLIDEFKEKYIEIEKSHNYIKDEHENISKLIKEKQQEEYTQKQYLELLRIEKIKKELLQREDELRELENNYNKVKASFESAKEELRFAEGKNYYLKYKEAYSKLKTIENEIKHKQENTKDTLELIKRLTIFVKNNNDEKIAKINDVIADNNLKIDKYNDIVANNNAEMDLLNQESGSNKALIQMAKEQLDSDKSALKEISSELDKLISTIDEDNYLIADEERYEKYNDDIEEYQEKVQKNNELIEINSDKISQFTSELVKIETELKYKIEEKNAIENNIKIYNEKKQHIDNIKSFFKLDAQISIDSLLNYIEVTNNEEYKNMYNCKQKIDEMNKKLDALKNGKIGADNDELINVYNFLQKTNGSVVLGSDYIKEKTKEEKEKILNRLPILPYSVIVDENIYAKIGKTIRFESLYLNTIIPIISTKALREDVCCNTESIFYVNNDIQLFINTEYIAVEIDKLSIELKKSNTELENHTQNVKIYQKYLTDVMEFKNLYESNINDYEQEYSRCKCLIAQIENDISIYNKDIAKLTNEKNGYIVDNEFSNGRINLLKDINVYLSQRIEIVKRIEDADVNISKYNKKDADIKKKISIIKEETNSANNKIFDAENENRGLYTRKADIERIWNEKYEKYFDSSYICNEKCDYDKDELIDEINGAIDAYEKENADVVGAMKACEAYKISTDNYIQELGNRGYEVNFFLEYEKDRGEVICSKDEIETKKNICNNAEKECNEVASTVNSKEKETERIRGELQIIQKKYNEEFVTANNPLYKEMVVTDDDKEKLDSVIREHKNRYNMLSGEIKGLNNKEKDFKNNLDEIIRILSNQTEYADAIRIELEHIDSNIKNYTDINTIKDNVENIKKKLKINTEKCNKLKLKSKDSKERCVREINQLNPNYAYQIERLEIPDELELLHNQIEDYKKSKEFLVQEIAMIDKSLEEIIEIKNRFNKKCIQKSLSIKADIDKFGKYSKMIIDSEEIQAVKIKIHYFPEDIQISKMERYIDRIVEDTSKNDNDDEKRRILRDKLSGKSLFGVIVNDAMGIEFSLYKRERIKENSRHLKYEEAVGSTGQSQGIYILLIIAIVNYISKMYSNELDENSITKTIFIDNPFGAAKDVYIWEPILSMLKDNNVQLIIPTRGVTPIMTSKFDVYYTLGQKMAGNKMQTVVVNYESKIKNEEVEYTKMKVEQLDLFSLMNE